MVNTPYASCQAKLLRCTFVIVHSFGGTALHQLNRFCWRHRRWQGEQSVSMVFDAAYSQRLELIGAGNAAHIGPELRLEIFGNQRSSIFGGKYKMDQDARIDV